MAKQPKITDYDLLTSPLMWEDKKPSEEEKKETKGVPKTKKSTKKSSMATIKAAEVTPEQRRAVEKAQNASRGRGHKKRNRVSVHFAAPAKVVEAIDDLHYRLGRTKNELYNEALELLVSKYVKNM